MIFIETSAFTRQVLELLPDEEYAAMQAALARDPRAGDVIRGTGGLRRFRWKRHGQEWRCARDLLLAER